MEKKFYNKLVRDRIPEIIESVGKKCEVVVLSESEFKQALLTKLIEEAQEVQNADPSELITELADLNEVLDTILKINGITRDSLSVEQVIRKSNRGGFKKRLKLIWSEDRNK
jgi:predicted house-cleaning noncanonical NTP pyrophosphatase (MazG superfamily)